MEKFTITVILISFNNSKYIFQALDSILKQTHPQIQLIISDDASKVFNLKKIQRYVKRHACGNITDVIYNVNKQNMGTVKHLESLYGRCSGELITLLAADDAFADEKVLERFALEYLKYDKKIQVITSQLAMCDTKLKKVKSLFISQDDINLINSDNSGLLLDELAYRCIMPSSGTVMTPEVYKQIGSLTDDYTYIEDWCSHLRIVRTGFKIRCLDTVSVLHRDGGISHGNKRVNYDVYLKYYRDLLTVYEKEVEPYQNLLSATAARRALQYYKWRVKRYNQDYAVRDVAPDVKKIVFYFRKGVVAKGDFALYYSIAAEISKNEDYAVYCVNNSNPEIKEQYIDSNIRFCEITEKNRHIFEGATFITAFNQVFFLLEEVEKIKNAKLLLLFLHPQICNWMSLQVNGTFNYNRVFKMLIENNAYAFIDEGNLYAAQKYCAKSFDKRFFPVNAHIDEYAPEKEYKETDDINIVWYGRLDGDKIYSLLNFLDNITGFDFGKPITMHIVGDGNAKNLIRLNKYAPQIRFVMNSFLYGEEKDRYLCENADMVLAMGMSSLDAARLKIPTVIPIVSPASFKENKFVLFCDTKGYCLGVNSEDMKKVGVKTYTAHNIVQLCCGDNKKEIGEKCYQFAKDNFAVEKQLNNYLSLINNTSLSLRRFKRQPSVKIQFTLFEIYRAVRGKRSYADYLIFKSKASKFLKLPLKEKIKKVLNKLKRGKD